MIEALRASPDPFGLVVGTSVIVMVALLAVVLLCGSLFELIRMSRSASHERHSRDERQSHTSTAHRSWRHAGT